MRRLDAIREHAIGIFRIVVGFLFACHGVKTLFGLLGAHEPAPVGTWPGWWAALIQLVAGTCVCLGIGTRAAALLGSGSMAFAYFTVHAPNDVLPIRNGGEQAALFCWTLLVLAFTGPGRFSLTGAIAAVRGTTNPAKREGPRAPVRG